MTDLGTLGGHFGFANWINDRGEVVGQSDLAGDQNAQPFLRADGHVIKLPTIYMALPRQRNLHRSLWRDGKMTDLPPVGGAAWAFGNAVNDLWLDQIH